MGNKEQILKEPKKLEELLFSRKFLVREVLCESFAASFTPISEMVIGGHSPRYETGYASRLKLKVDTLERELPVKELYFEGVSAVKSGDTISALMPVYREEKSYIGSQHVYDDGYRSSYFLRELKEQEKAIEIKIILDKTVLRTDRAVDYIHFVPKSV